MKLSLIAVASTVVALSFAAYAEDMSGMKMDAAPMTQQAPVARAAGTIKAIDGEKHTVTIAHGAVPVVQWPPMTMGFRATEAQLAGVKVGDSVNFEFQLAGSTATLVSIDVAK